MLRSASKLSSAISFSFATSSIIRNGTNPIQQRVMATPTWPVPYYQRAFKAYPVSQPKNVDLLSKDCPADDATWLMAKRVLSTTLKGRQIVEYTEQHINTKTFLIHKDDCETMAKAYVNDICQFLDISNKQNVRILKGKTLI